MKNDLIEHVGDPEAFVLVSHVNNKTTCIERTVDAMEVPGGCLVRTLTRHWAGPDRGGLAEAMVFVPGTTLSVDYKDGNKFAWITTNKED